MAVLTMIGRKSYLKNRINQLEYNLMLKQQTKNNLSSYASSVADGSISYEDLTNCPANLFGRMTNFMMASHGMAMTGAQQQMGMMQAAGQIGAAEGEQQQAYNNLIFQNLYKQQRERIAQNEARILNEQEKVLDQEIMKLENELSLVQSEYASLSKTLGNAIQSETVTYVA